MRAEIISIGTEILIGSITNTNARFLSENLASSAIDVYHQITVGDNAQRLVEALETAASRADLIVTSGGLGPTEDDVTLEAILSFLNKPPDLHRPTYRYIQKRLRLAGYKMSKVHERQCYVPQGSAVFQNKNGAAPGILARTERGGRPVWLIALPGPPRELEPLFKDQALPAFLRRARIKREHFVTRSIKISGLTETQVAEKVPDLLRARPPLTTGIYARPDLVTLRIMAKSPSMSTAQRMVRRAERTIRRRLGSAVFGADADTLSSVTGALLAKHKKTVAVAESCSGGMLGSLITDTPGSSAYFLGGVIAYHNRVKTAELGVDEDVLNKYGAVSEETAQSMARGALKKFGSDFGVAITGIAGPDGGSLKKPVGLVYIALADKKGVIVKKSVLRGSRHEIKTRAAHRALNLLRLKL